MNATRRALQDSVQNPALRMTLMRYFLYFSATVSNAESYVQNAMHYHRNFASAVEADTAACIMMGPPLPWCVFA